MSLECMLDIETLGKGNNALILSIGAVKFDPRGEELDESFYITINPEDAQGWGLDIDASTVIWWMGKSDSAREAFKNPYALGLVDALNSFKNYLGCDMPVWGNGATFDNVILKNAYEVIGEPTPWTYRSDRCYRTLAAICPDVKMSRIGTFHNAVDDAKSQALHLQRIYKKLGLN